MGMSVKKDYLKKLRYICRMERIGVSLNLYMVC